MVTEREIEQIAQRVAQILSNGPVNAEPFDGMACVAGPPRQAPNDKLCNEVAQKCLMIIINELHSDEEQFLSISQVRSFVSAHWDDQLRMAGEMSKVNSNRAQTLGKFIEMTAAR